MQAGFMGGLYRFAEWIARFVYVNLLWIGFSLLGLIIFGFFPATAAMFSVVRKWVLKEIDIPIFKTFWKTYKKEFAKSNFLGLILCIIGYIFYVDLLILKEATNSLLQLAYYPLLAITLVYLLTVLYVFPVFVHYDTKLLQVLKNAILIMMMHPIISLLMGIAAVTVSFTLFLVPVLILIFGGSIIAFILMWHSNHSFIKIQQRKSVTESI